jgi:molybdenum ABC transporter molybdate-binding protein
VIRLLLLAGLFAGAAGPVLAEQPLRLFGAGSLREAITEVTAAYTGETGRPVQTSFGFSGLMRERIERGEPTDLFTSADMGHPLALLREGRATRVVLFVRNSLCLVARAGSGLSEATAIDRLMDPALPLGIFPAVQDPVGDYTLELFRAVEVARPGAEAALRERAFVVSEALVGRALAPGEDLAMALLREGRIGIHVSYCSTARNHLLRQKPKLAVAALPPAFRIGPEYGLATLRDAHASAAELALFVLAPEAQATLARHGFEPIARPR